MSTRTPAATLRRKVVYQLAGSSRWSSSVSSMLTGVDEPHHRYAKLTIAIATLQSAAAELVIMD